MNKDSKILIVGHDDVIGISLFQYFQSNGFKNIFSSSKIGLDVLNQSIIHYTFDKERFDYVFLASIRSGGIGANQKYAAEFIYENLECQNNIIHAAYEYNVKKLVFFSGSCVYPKECVQPMKEECLLTGPLEVTSEPYTIAKIAGIKLCQTYKAQYGFDAIVVIPATVYGPGEDIDSETSHVIGALIKKFHDAKLKGQKEVIVWGTGKPRREFLYMDDFVEAALFLMEEYNDKEIINVGCGSDVSIKELAEMMKEISAYTGKIVLDETKPDGTMLKLMDNSRIAKMGWKAKVDLKEGVQRTYEWYSKRKTMELKK